MSNNHSMESDDSKLVDDILNEINGETAQPIQPLPSMSEYKDPTNFSMNTSYSPNIPLETGSTPLEHIKSLPDSQEIVYNSTDSKLDRIISTIKKPLIIILLIFIIFNPYTLAKLGIYFPAIFASSNFIGWKSHVKTLILATIVGLLYMGANSLI